MAPSRGAYVLGLTRTPQRQYICSRCLARRSFAATSTIYSGHSRWSKIKHDKAKTDAGKNKQRSVFAHAIALASRLYGPEPANNPRLSELVVKAKREGFPKASIENAIARGQGKSASGAQLEAVTLEGILPGNVGVMVDCETDNRLRTLAMLRLILKDAGGAATPCAYLFNKRGRITFEAKEGIGVDEALEAALEAGALDVEENEDDGGIVLWSEPEDTKAVGETVAAALGLEISTSDIVWSPNDDTRVGVSGEEAAQGLCRFADDLQERESSVQAIAMNIGPGVLDAEAWKDLSSRVST